MAAQAYFVDPPGRVEAAAPARLAAEEPVPDTGVSRSDDQGAVDLTRQLGQAMALVIQLGRDRGELVATRDSLQQAHEQLRQQLDALQATQQVTVAELAAARQDVADVVVAAYKNGGADGGSLTTLLSARDASEVGVRRVLLRHAGNANQVSLQRWRKLRDETGKQLRALAEQSASTDRALAQAVADVSTLDARVAQAQDVVTTTGAALSLRIPTVSNAALTILGPSTLTAGQLAGWTVSAGYKPNIDTPIVDLAAMYIDEGNAEGIRGDVAFVQSVIETGGFSFPAGGQLTPSDYNFAGIGACDSCDRGLGFADTRSGVRAQIALLHFYADETMTVARLARPLTYPGLVRGSSVAGCCPTWYSLTGVWATNPIYGATILSLYAEATLYGLRNPDPVGTVVLGG